MDYSSPPLIAHILYRFDVGGLENGVVNLLNRIPATRYRHVIISLTDATDFKKRLNDPNIEIYCLNKKSGQDPVYLWRLWKLLRKLKPDIVHTRNLAALETVVIAWLAGVRKRVHSEHGWGMTDLHGENTKYRMLRRFMSYLVHRYIGLSKHLQQYLARDVGIKPSKLGQLYNGVDADRFCPRSESEEFFSLFPQNWLKHDSIVIGTVGRMEPVKDQVTLARAFVLLCRENPDLAQRLRLAMIGDGELRTEVKEILQQSGLIHQAWLPGSDHRVAEIMRAMDIFVLPSRNEGISNTILEAMATALPVVATAVGGNPELVENHQTGILVKDNQPQEMMQAMRAYVIDPDKRRLHGIAGRQRVEQYFKLERMVENYIQIYDSLCKPA